MTEGCESSNFQLSRVLSYHQKDHIFHRKEKRNIIIDSKVHPFGIYMNIHTWAFPGLKIFQQIDRSISRTRHKIRLKCWKTPPNQGPLSLVFRFLSSLWISSWKTRRLFLSWGPPDGTDASMYLGNNNNNSNNGQFSEGIFPNCVFFSVFSPPLVAWIFVIYRGSP